MYRLDILGRGEKKVAFFILEKAFKDMEENENKLLQRGLEPSVPTPKAAREQTTLFQRAFPPALTPASEPFLWHGYTERSDKSVRLQVS